MALGPIMLDLSGAELTLEEQEILQHPHVGGVIYFARNFTSATQIEALTASIREVREELLIAVDQEGGRVQRFRDGFTRLPPMQQYLPLFRKNPQAALSLVQDSAWLMASELLTLGIDFSFAPVLDVDDCRCEVIGNRSFSPKPDEVIALAGAWIAGMQEAGMAATGKHFPGHGSVIADSHLELPVDDREFAEIAERDLLPFAALSRQLDAVMPAHILFPKVDDEQSVGFSQYWLQTVLRKDLGFKGVIFSDDLSMAGAGSAGSFSERAALALHAGCDMVLVCNNPQGVREVLDSALLPPPVESQQRLQTMRARQTLLTREFLEDEPRWQLTQQLLSAIA